MATKEELIARFKKGYVITEQDMADLVEVAGVDGKDGKDGLSMLTEEEQISLKFALDEAYNGKGDLSPYIQSIAQTQYFLEVLVKRLVSIHPEEFSGFIDLVPLSMSAEVLESESKQPISEEGKEEKE